MISAYNDTPIIVNQEYDPEERLAKAIIKQVADEYLDASWMVYCYDKILDDIEKTEDWLAYTASVAKINAVRTQVEKIRETVRRNAISCNKMGGKTDNCFPYAAISSRSKGTDDQAYINQLAVNREYMIEWRKTIELLQTTQKKLEDMESDFKDSPLMAIKREHNYIENKRKSAYGTATAKLHWFGTRYAHILMMCEISNETIIRQLKRRSESNIKRMKKDRVEAGMHPYDLRQDTEQQRLKMRNLIMKRREVSV